MSGLPTSECPALSPRAEAPAELAGRVARTLRISTIEGCITAIFFAWTTGSVVTGYLLYLGAGPLTLAAVSSIPHLVQVVNVLMAWLAARLGSRKALMIATASVGRMVWLVPAFIPLLYGAGPHALLAMVGVILFSALFQTASGPLWISLMADVVPEDIRGRYFGWRTAVIGVVGMVASLAAGLYLDRVEAPLGFQMVFVFATLFALVGLWLYRFYHEVGTARVRASWVETVLTPLRDANFRRFLAFSMYWQGAVMVAASFVIPYFFQHLGMSFTQVAIWGAIASLASLITGPLWGRIGDQAGHKTVLTVTTVLAGSVHPLCWLLATPGHMFFIYLSGFMDAISWGGLNPAMFNLSLATAPRRHRMSYLAVLGVANGLVGFTAGMLSGPLLEFLLRYDAVIAGYHWTGYHSLFAISGLLRMQAWRLLRPVYETKAQPAASLLRSLKDRVGELILHRE